MQATFPLLLALLSVASAQAPAPIIDVGNARYQGSVNAATNISSYLGIRYAAAPIGDLRFRAPQNPPALDGIQQATAEPQQCLQAGSGNSPTNPNPTTSLISRATQDPEDCLFLNVFFPGSTVPTRPLPVVFWIHGGGYVAGGAGSFNGGDLISDAKNGVVTVIIQYRLGIFGFLSGSQVKANGALNAGLLDQEFALKWVQQHISKFGGDPDRVTIWGQSAAADYALRLFPDLGTANAATVARLYAGVGTPIDQANAIMGECWSLHTMLKPFTDGPYLCKAIFICPTYFMLNAFPGTSFKGEFAVPNGSHGEDVAFYFTSSGPPAFNNPTFITAFSGAFMDFASSLDPNRKIDSTNITPQWSRHLIANAEMLFNRTVDGQPDIRAITTSSTLLQRCASPGSYWLDPTSQGYITLNSEPALALILLLFPKSKMSTNLDAQNAIPLAAFSPARNILKATIPSTF
ncbi:hypothetical protein EYR40_007459 [Pleurotus pulmonarius]|nr:hypothetical protein EYR40_007459 [Pleurotus pulmonarius]